ncbi:unnamed protein product [Schistosoma haematobium]|nr:unnamed protein product [Schistosoma haematobium]
MHLQSISINQSQPAVNGSFSRRNDGTLVKPKLSFKYYSSQVTQLVIFSSGGISMHGQDRLGYISPFRSDNTYPEFEISDEKELLAVRWFINKDVDGKQFTAKVTCLIHPNGKIMLYYDNIPTEIKGIEWKPKIVGKFSCGGNETVSEIITPETWINSGTLVEYEAVRNYCPKYTSPKACQRATTSNITCFWCDKANICIDSTDQDAHNMKVNNCRVKNPDVNGLSTQTTEETDQHSNMTTEENLEKKSSRRVVEETPSESNAWSSFACHNTCSS